MAEQGWHRVDRTEPFPGELDQNRTQLQRIASTTLVIANTVILIASLLIALIAGLVLMLIPTDAPWWMRLAGVVSLALVAGGHSIRTCRADYAT